jgi:hypothetical protein
MATQWISPTWRMPENSNQDKVSNYSLTLDGANDYVIADLDGTSTGGILASSDSDVEVTISFWFYMNGSQNLKGIFQWANSLLDTSPMILVNTSGASIKTWVDGAYRHTSGLTMDAWHHYAVTRTASTNTWEGYLDNVSVFTADDGGTIQDRASALELYFGHGYNGYLNGKMTGVSLYNSALSATQITALYNSGTPVNPMALTPLPIAYYPLGGKSTGSSTTLTVPNEAVPSATVFDFNGASSQYVSAAFNGTGEGGSVFGLQGDLDLTLSFWFYRKSNTVALGLFSWATGLTSGAPFLLIQQNLTNLRVFWDGGYRSGTQVTAQDEWNHVVITRTASDNTLRGYLNGNTTPWFSYDDSGTPNIQTNATNIFLGNGYNGYFTGEMANCQIWNTALSAANVTTLYNNGVPLYTGTQPEAANLQLWWKLNVDNSTWGGSNWSITDSSGEGNTGTSSGMTTANLVTSDLTRSIPYSSYSMQFDATNDYIIVPANVLTNFTTSVWLNRDGNGNYDGILGQDTTSAKGGILRYVALQDDDIYVFIGAWTTVATSLPLNTWIHFCLTYDSTADELKSYINGVVDTTVASPNFSGASTDAHSFTRIGLRNGTDATSFPGKLSNVSLFNSALSEDQILTIYNGGVPNDISSLSPVSWWSLGGDSYYNGTDWICPDLGSAGNNGTSANMAGTEIIGDGPGSTANGTATNMDIPANLKGEAPNSTSNAFSINMTEIDRVTSVPG